ncbi:MucR family transcriptional regulator (plasmid) [Citrobacter sp. Y3]|nr:MucR family transcriptional regulator [Citrobacter sp. Y3]
MADNDDATDKIRCLECGKEFSFLAPHLSKAHQMNARQYRERWAYHYTRRLPAPNIPASVGKVFCAVSGGARFAPLTSSRSWLKAGRMLLNVRPAPGCIKWRRRTSRGCIRYGSILRVKSFLIRSGMKPCRE